MAFVTLTTDWNSNDFYVGAVKGTILSLNNAAQVIDLNHQITLFNWFQAGFVVRNAYHYYPKGTVHIIDVFSETTELHKHVAVLYNGHYFVGTDNGMFSLVFKETPEKVVRIDQSMGQECLSFPSLHVFAPVAAFISMGNDIEELGEIIPDIFRQSPMLPIYEESLISGNIMFIDTFGNVISNISKHLFDKIGKGRPFEILFLSNRYKITRINKTYSETREGEILALFNASGLLELAQNQGNIAEIFDLKVKTSIMVRFL